MKKIRIWIPAELKPYVKQIRIGLNFLVDMPFPEFPEIRKTERTEEKCVTIVLDEYGEACLKVFKDYQNMSQTEVIKGALIVLARKNLPIS